MDPLLIECMQAIDGLRACGLDEPAPETVIQTINDGRRVSGLPPISPEEANTLQAIIRPSSTVS